MNVIMKNAISGFICQIIILLLGFIVPRIIILNYGSDVNGLFSTITQIFTYMSLLEAGIGQATRNLLYKPFKSKDKNKISDISSLSQKYFKKITYYYFIGIILVSLIMPFIIKSQINRNDIFLCFLFQGLSGCISFYFIQTQTIILSVDGKGYVNNYINVINQILSYGSKILLALLGVNIVFIQIVFFIITIIKVLWYRFYFIKKYDWIDFTRKTNKHKLKDKNSFIISEISWTIFSSTDMIILSIFVSTKISSVYYIYSLIFSSVSLLLNSVYNNINYILGREFHNDLKRYEKIHDLFNTIFMGMITILISTAYVIAIPFVKLYSNGINDVNYIYEQLPLLFSAVQILSWSRYITGNLTAVAGYAKKTSYISLIEAVVNIILSLILVSKYGIVGVLIATVTALPLKVVYCTYLSDKKILKRKMFKTYKILLINYIVFFINLILLNIINKYEFIKISSYKDLVVFSIIVMIIVTIIEMIINIIFNYDNIKYIKKYLGKELRYVKNG